MHLIAGQKGEPFTYACTSVPYIIHNIYTDGSVQDGSNYSGLAMGLLYSCTKPAIYNNLNI